MGVALFTMVLTAFFLVQSVVFISGVLASDPEFAEQGFSPGLLSDPVFRERMNDLLFNGDLVARQALWSGLFGSLLILGTVWLWKRDKAVDLLGLRLVPVKRYLPWIGLFILLALVIEGLPANSPAFRTDIMERVLTSTTDMRRL